MEFIETLNKLIQKNNITKTELARQIDVSEGTIRQWYNGKMPTLDKIIKLSNYFTISIDDLVGNQITREDNISAIYNKLNPEDKQIVDIIFNKYKKPKENLSSNTKIS